MYFSQVIVTLSSGFPNSPDFANFKWTISTFNQLYKITYIHDCNIKETIFIQGGTTLTFLFYKIKLKEIIVESLKTYTLMQVHE